jgi:MoaA/NifB/PqqE/SkfB family radical SAM enzyme
MRVLQMAARALVDGGPSTCQFAITNLCNARCGFCNFAYDKMPASLRRSVTLDEAKLATDVLYRNGVRFLIYVGGEPTMHDDLPAMMRHARDAGMTPMVVTNGSTLMTERIEELAASGLKSAIISIDAARAEVHEQNRGLKGVCERIRQANETFARLKIGTTASVTMSRLIDDYHALPPFLRELGFSSVTFSYPLTTLASSYLGFAESDLVDYRPDELDERFEAVKALKREFHVVNPVASIEDMQRHLRKEPERFECLGGWKQFYLDWNLMLYRCHNWSEPMCHVSEFDGSQRVRDGCTACMMDCYRDSSVLQHVAISVSDSVQALRKGRVGEAAGRLFTRNNLVSIRSVMEEGKWLLRL